MNEEQPSAAIDTPTPPTPTVGVPAVSSLPSTADIEIKVKPPVAAKRARYKKCTPQQIDQAMQVFGGKLADAAGSLGFSVKHLQKRISDVRWLREKWPTLGTKAKMAASIALVPLSESEIEIKLDNNVRDLETKAVQIEGKLAQLAKRIELGESAILDPTNPKFKEFKFRWGVRGEPAEEQMLREHYLGLIEEFRNIKEEIAAQLRIKSAIVKELRGGKPNNPNQNRPGFRPKGQTQIVAQPGSTVNIK